MSGPPEYTVEQMHRIKEGIKAGRLAMEKRGASAGVFVDAFCKAGGFQVPGLPQISDDHLRVLGSIVLMWLEGPDYGLLNNWRWINDAMIEALHREINRAHQEVSMFGASRHPDAYGWRFVPSPNAVDKEACQRLAECDNYGLGNGIFPLDETLVFQPIYDHACLEIVYRDEVSQAYAPSDSETKAIKHPANSRNFPFGLMILVGAVMFFVGYVTGMK